MDTRPEQLPQGLLPLGTSVRSIATLLCWSNGQAVIGKGDSHWAVYKGLKRKISDFSATDTPYGKLLTEVTAPWGGKVIVWNPSCALWYLCYLMPEFGDFLRSLKKSHDHKFSVLLNEDVFKVGNVLRPDKGRGIDAVYYTLKDYLSVYPWLLGEAGEVPG